MMGHSTEAIAEAREVAAELDRLGSPGESAQGHLFLGNMLADDKSTPDIRAEALGELGEAIRYGEKAQDPRRVGWALYHSSELLRDDGRAKEAVEKAERAGDTLGRIGDRTGQSLAKKVLGQLAMDAGRFDLAEKQLGDALRLLQGSKNTLNEIDVLLRLAQLAHVRGDRDTTLRHVAELTRLQLPVARPDLAREFRELQERAIGGS
jgi:tetratricopeptide (TPR) repeat protein